MTALAEVFVEGRIDTSRFGSDLNRGVDSASRGFGSRMGGLAKIAGVALGGAAAYGALSFAKGAVSLEAEFGKTMNQLQANLQAPQSEMAKLSDLAMKMGKDTVFSAKDASDAMLELARGGMSAAAIKGGALASSLTLAAAGGVDMSRSAEVMGNALNTFNLNASQSGEVAAALAGAANASSASIDSVAQGLQQVGTVAADAGFSIQETTGAIAALANAGIAGSDAGTSLKTMFANLVPQTDKAFDALSQYGLVNYSANIAAKTLAEDGIKAVGRSYDDTYKAVEQYMISMGEGEAGTAKLAKATTDYLQVTGIMHNSFLKQNGDYKSLGSIAGTLKAQLSGLSDSERATALSTIFGSDARRAATVLMNEGEKGLAKYVKATSDQTAADKQAAAATKGTAGAIEQMKGSIETAQLAWGKAQKPIIMFGATLVTQIANGAVPIIESLGGAFRKHLSDIDLSGIGDALAGINWSSVADGSSDIGKAFGDIGTSLKSIDWSSLKDAIGEGAADTVSVFAVAIGFAADHVDTLAKYLPALVAGFILYKAAQAASNVVALASLPIQAANVAALFLSASANRALAAQMMITNGVERVGLLMRARAIVVTGAMAAAHGVAAASAGIWTAAQWLLNAALTANPIGLVVVALGALAIGLAIAWKKSETFRKVVTMTFGVVKEKVQIAALYVADKVLWMAEKMLGAMAFAFSWVPGLGDKLKKASAAIKEFREDVNREMDQIRDEEVNIGFAVGRRKSQESSNSGRGPQITGGRGPIPRSAMGGGGNGLVFRPQTSGAMRGVAQVASSAQASAHETALALAKKEKAKHAKQGMSSGHAGPAGAVLPPGSYRIGMPYHGYAGHDGADYPAAIGTPVYAPWAGRVTASYDMPGSNPYNSTPYRSYGRVVKIAYENGMTSLFAHLSERIGRLGPIAAGTMVGRVGTNGNSSGPHLHAEFNGGSTNPASLGIFDRGGIMKGLGINLSGQPERVLSPYQTKLHERQTLALEKSARGGGLRPIHVHVGNQEFVRMVDDRIESHVDLTSERRRAR